MRFDRPFVEFAGEIKKCTGTIVASRNDPTPTALPQPAGEDRTWSESEYRARLEYNLMRPCVVNIHMDDTHSSELPLDAVAETVGEQATEAFELLGNDTRLAILLALWDAFDPYETKRSVAFSELYDRVDIRDSANFTYHLDKLTDHFVEKTNEGYKLRNAGLAIVRAIVAGAGLDEQIVSPTELGISCHHCGDGRVDIRYQDEAVYLTCSECEGFLTTKEYPHGTIVKFWLDPAGVKRRGPQELLVASLIRTENHNRMMEQGVCPACSGTIDASLQICEDHHPEPGEVCPNCNTRDSVRVGYICSVCKYRNRRPVELTVVDHPAVISFYDDHDIDPRWDVNDVERCIRMLERLWEIEHSLVSTDPIRIHVTVPCESDELRLELDDRWEVIEVGKSD